MRHLLLSLAMLAACADELPTTSSSPDVETSSTTAALGGWAPPIANTLWKIPFNAVNPYVSGWSSCFNKAMNQIVHAGEDWAYAAGTAVRAIGPGTVVYAANANYPGWVIVVRHDLGAAERAALGIAQPSIYSMYGHLTNVIVGNGQQVSAGQQLASIVDQGSNSHVHWEVRTVLTPQLCTPWPPGPGYTDAGTDARNWGYLSPSGSVAALNNAAPATCDNNVPVGGTACNPSDPVAQFRCTTPSAPSSQQWTRELCLAGQSCSGDHCQGGVPACGSGLYCAGSQIPGASQCMSGSTAVFCCPSGQTIINGACSGYTIPACGTGLYCAGSQIPGASQCMSGSTAVFCCAPGHTIVNGACS